jgi:acetoin utilization deacetylase AcuC-like enzyme
MNTKSGVVYDECFENHFTGLGHPEQSIRATHVYKSLQKAKLLDGASVLQPTACDEKILNLVHTEHYLSLAKKDIDSGKSSLSTGDTHVSRESWSVARTASGAGTLAVDHIFSGELQRLFCIVRPPGHHATPTKGMGFCLFNHIAIAARYAQKTHGVGKVLIVDWDVHHGNGTQDIFYEDESVYFMSVHQHPWYPGTGTKDQTGQGKGLGTTLNFPLPAGSARKEIVEDSFGVELKKKMNKYRPELIMISAGFDSRVGDPLGQFALEDQDFADLTLIIRDLAEECCDGRIISFLEGGYNLDGLSKAASCHFQALCSF